MADGLDRAIAGLGQPDTARLDLMGLLGYDRQVISSLDLTVNNAQQGGYLDRFELHSGVDKPSILLKGIEGEMRLECGRRHCRHRGASRSAAGRTCVACSKRVDATGQRGQANVALVEQMKAALTQLQTAVATPATTGSLGPASASHAGLAGASSAATPGGEQLKHASARRQRGLPDQPTDAGWRHGVDTADGVGATVRRLPEAPGDRMLNA